MKYKLKSTHKEHIKNTTEFAVIEKKLFGP